jgi:hypothetical protein
MSSTPAQLALNICCLVRLDSVAHRPREQMPPKAAAVSLELPNLTVPVQQVSANFRGGQSDRRGGLRSPFRRSPTAALAVIGARKPMVCFCCSEQSSIAVAAVGIPVELARTLCRHRTCL